MILLLKKKMVFVEMNAGEKVRYRIRAHDVPISRFDATRKMYLLSLPLSYQSRSGLSCSLPLPSDIIGRGR